MPLVETDAMVVEKTGRPSRTFCPGRGGRLPPGGDRRRPPGRGHGGTVISTGGGIILRPRIWRSSRHRHRLFPGPGPQGHRQHGAGRPAPAQRGGDRVFLLYDQRINLYRKYARYTVPSTTVDEQWTPSGPGAGGQER